MTAVETALHSVEQFVQLFTADDVSLERKKACTDFFDKSVAPLPAAHVRRLLIADNDILRRFLTKMQQETAGLVSGVYLKPVLECGWLLLYKAHNDSDGPQQPEAALSKRLFCKQLLLDIPALTDAALAVFNQMVPFFSMIAKNPDQQWVQVIFAHADTTSQVLDVFIRLLIETRKEGHIRGLSRILSRLHGLNKALFLAKVAFMQKYGASGDAAIIRLIGALHSLWLTGAVIIERFAESAPPECMFEPSEIISHGCTVPRSSPRFAGRQISQFRSDSVLRELLSELAGKGVTFNKEYVNALRCGPDTHTILFRTAVILICRLPDEKLRSIVAKSSLPSVLAIRRCAGDINWYSIPKPQRVCFASGCGKRGESFGECSGCGVAEYCSAECQRDDWPKHKPMCLRYQEKMRALPVFWQMAV